MKSQEDDLPLGEVMDWKVRFVEQERGKSSASDPSEGRQPRFNPPQQTEDCDTSLVSRYLSIRWHSYAISTHEAALYALSLLWVSPRKLYNCINRTFAH